MAPLLTPRQIERILETTDSFLLHRDQVVVPLRAVEDPEERIMPDGKLLVQAPGGKTFERWFAGLADRLEKLPLHRTPRVTH